MGNKLTAISLFTGVGGIDLGLDRAGIETVLMCEYDPWKRSVLAAHWPEVPIHDDVRTLCDGDSPLARAAGIEQPVGSRDRRPAGRVDLIHGGFPCQDVSIAGKRAGLAGERTGLFWDALRVVDAVRPRAVLLENVPGLLSSQSGRDFAVVVDALAERGYGVAWRILDAQHFGVPQRRRRVFVLAIAGDDPRAASERAGEVLALRESVRWDPEARNEAGDTVAARALLRVDDGRGEALGPGRVNRGDGGRRFADTLTSGSHPNSNRPGRRREDDTNIVPTHRLSPTLTKSGGGQNQNANTSQQEYVAFHLTQNPISGSVAPTMGKGNPQGCATVGVAFRKSARVNADPDSNETWVNDGLANTLNRFDVGDVRTTHAIVQPSTGVRRLTPRECERLMGWPEVLDIEGIDDDHVRRAIQGIRTEAGAAIHPGDPLLGLWLYGEGRAAPPGHSGDAGYGRGALRVVSSARALARGVGGSSRTGGDVHRVRFHLPPEASTALSTLLGSGLSSGDGASLGGEAVAYLTGWTAPPGMNAPDSRRYAACGDGVATPVAEWIGHRLAGMLMLDGTEATA